MTTLQLYQSQFKLKLTEDRSINPLSKLWFTESLKCSLSEARTICQRMGHFLFALFLLLFPWSLSET